jgi:hypothetical protein
MQEHNPSGSAELNNKYPMTNKNLWVSYKFLLLKPPNDQIGSWFSHVSLNRNHIALLSYDPEEK